MKHGARRRWCGCRYSSSWRRSASTIVSSWAAVAADLRPSRPQPARRLRARHRQRGVAGDEVARAVPVSAAIAVIVDRPCRRRRVDGDGLAVGRADIARRVHHPRLIAEAGGVRGGGVVIAPGGAVDCVTVDQLAPPSLLTCTFSPAASAPVACPTRSAWCRW